MQPYQERLLNEYVELYDKITNLTHFIQGVNDGKINIVLNYDINLLLLQCNIMDSYLYILKMRIRLEDIETELEEYMCKFLN